jgi:RNA-directed DNA polymerase
MSVEISTCASPAADTPWHSINWVRCHRMVKKLQIRIVKATQESRCGKVKSLQRLLTRSFSGKAIAIKRVTENQGKRTPGVDNVTWSTPESKSQALLSLQHRGYKSQPLKRIYIPKANGKLRPLGIPVVKCRAMQALHLLALEPIAETTADKNSYGFRPERATADAIEQCFCALSRKYSAQWILEGDITGCFDNISHVWLLKNIPLDKTILRKWLKAGYIDQQTLFATKAGTPQGGIISPALSNMTLDGLEKILQQYFPRNTQVNFIRYADDFVITGRTKEILEHEVKPLVEKFLAERGLTLSVEKTKITHIEKGFDFLGQNVRKYNGKLLIKPSKKNIKAFLDKIRKMVKKNRTAKQQDLIKQLNPVIKGRSEYHKNVVSSKIFASVDREIWWILWRWATRRHPLKNKGWVKAKYFKQVCAHHRVFAMHTGKLAFDDKPELLTLHNATDSKIQRHIKIKADANPYDPQWEIYFENRLNLKMKNTFKGHWKLASIWGNQRGLCPICQQKITFESTWHTHHIQPRCEGGKDNISNLIMVHPNCHRQIHSQRLTVVKPASHIERL